MQKFFDGKRKFIISMISIIVPIAIISLHFMGYANNKEAISKDGTHKNKMHLVSTDELNLADDLKLEKIGTASYYGSKFHARRTANGEIYDMYSLSAAHKKLPFGTILKITNVNNGETILTRINDRGPYVNNRLIDLSYKTAKEIDGLGLPKIKMEGFLPGQLPTAPDKNEVFYYGYSVCNDLVCVPAKTFDVVTSTKGFNKAYKIYKELQDQNSDINYYIFVRADKKYFKESKKKGFNYVIGILRDQIPVTPEQYAKAKKTDFSI